MAKVKSVSSNFYGNKTSFPELKFGLEIVEDCSPKCDFDISSFITDIDSNLDKQSFDNDNLNGNIDNKKSKCSSLISSKIECPKFTSLDALAENHLKQDKMLCELDFNLSDLLSIDDYSSVKNSKNVTVCESDNLFDFLLTEDDGPRIKTPSANSNVSYDDLSVWMNSSITQSSNSSEIFNISDLLHDDTEGKFENTSSTLPEMKKEDNIGLFNCLENNQEKSGKANISNIDLVQVHKETSINNYELSNNLDSTDSSKIKESTNENSDVEFFPDIDLTFCIKKNSKSDYTFYGKSPETTDSGFDESDFVSEKLSIPSKEPVFYKNMFMLQSEPDSKTTSIKKNKQSLFSKAISAKPKIDGSRKSKLKAVRNELLKESMLVLHPTQEVKLQEITDCSNENVIISSYLKFGDKK